MAEARNESHSTAFIRRGPSQFFTKSLAIVTMSSTY